MAPLVGSETVDNPGGTADVASFRCLLRVDPACGQVVPVWIRLVYQRDLLFSSSAFQLFLSPDSFVRVKVVLVVDETVFVVPGCIQVRFPSRRDLVLSELLIVLAQSLSSFPDVPTRLCRCQGILSRQHPQRKRGSAGVLGVPHQALQNSPSQWTGPIRDAGLKARGFHSPTISTLGSGPSDPEYCGRAGSLRPRPPPARVCPCPFAFAMCEACKGRHAGVPA